jgi:hypothetical protein
MICRDFSLFRQGDPQRVSRGRRQCTSVVSSAILSPNETGIIIILTILSQVLVATSVAEEGVRVRVCSFSRCVRIHITIFTTTTTTTTTIVIIFIKIMIMIMIIY